MYFPTANIETSVFLPPMVAFVVSFFTSMGGISGAFLLLPFQVSVLGYTAPSVSATNQLYNIVAIPSGIIRFIQEDRMLWPLALVVVLGTLPGVLLGAIVRLEYLPDPSDFKIFAGLVLLYMGLRLGRDCVMNRNAKTPPTQSPPQHSMVSHVQWSLYRVHYTFRQEQYTFSTMAVFSLCLVVGLIGGIYGIGGGAIISPFLVSAFGLPVYTVAAAALLGTFATSIAGVLLYMALAPWYPHLSVSPDWLLGLLLGFGGMVGMYCGARCQRFVPAHYIRMGLAVILLATAISYFIS